jgi:hypothetical protein
MRSLDVFESHARKRVSILHWGQPWFWTTSWPHGYYPFVPALLTAVRDPSAIPLVDWGSWDLSAHGSADQQRFALSTIIRGDHDDYVTKWATAARDWGHLLPAPGLGDERHVASVERGQKRQRGG